MAQPRVLYLSVARLKDQKLLAEYFESAVPLRSRVLVETNFTDVLQQSCSQALSTGQRMTRSLDSGAIGLFVSVLQEGQFLVGAAVNSQEYPERLAWRLLQEYTDVVKSTAGEQLSTAPAEGLTRPLKRSMKELMAKYENPAEVDKIAEVRDKVDATKGIMQDNVKRILENHADLQALEDKTDSMQTSANQFLKQAVDMRRNMQLRNLKLKIILALIVIALLLYLLLPLLN